MRMKKREVTEKEEIFGILARSRVVRVGMFGGAHPYVVPVSFGMEVADRGAALYFHCTRKGLKADLLAADGRVCVGVIVAGEVVVYCVPKYLHRHVEPSGLRPVFSALRKYHSDTEDANLTLLDESMRSSRISLILALLASYEEHGLYINQERIQQTNG